MAPMKIFPEKIPLSARDAVASGMTWYKSMEQCPIHHTSLFWARSKKCMACEDIHGEKLAPFAHAKKPVWVGLRRGDARGNI